MKISCKKCCTEPYGRSWYSISWVASIGCAELKSVFFQVQDSILRCAKVFQVILYWGAPAWFACTARPLSLKGFGRKVLGLSFQQIPSIDRDVCWGDGLAINIFLKQRLHQALWWWEILVRNFVFKQLVITVKYSAFNKSSLQKRGDDPWCLG